MDQRWICFKEHIKLTYGLEETSTPKYFTNKNMKLCIAHDLNDFVLTADTMPDFIITRRKSHLQVHMTDILAIINVILQEIPVKTSSSSCITTNRSRVLQIYVWGRKKRKRLAVAVDHNFNAAVLHGKKSGTNWRKDGRTLEIREAVMRCPLFNDFLNVMLQMIETKDMSAIGINCRAGRHRSVTLAIILQMHYYPLAQLHFLELS